MNFDPAHHDWLTHPDVRAIFKAFPDGRLRFVGGCVRNTLMGFEIGDIDLATQLEPDEVLEHLKRADIRTIPTGLPYGTITAIINGQAFEITSLRQDVQTDGRRAVVAYTEDWAEDARRRDLTINALYADPNGKIYDPTGQGVADIEELRFRFVGKPDQRVREDYLRILRFFRFIAWYGESPSGEKGIVEAESLQACREHSGSLGTLSTERIWAEIKKTLMAARPARAVRMMLHNDVLDKVLPEASNYEGLERYLALETLLNLPIDPLRRLMAMAGRDAVAMARLCKRLKLSKAEKTRLIGWAGDMTALSWQMDEREIKQAVYKAGSQVIEDRTVLRAAGADEAKQRAAWVSLADFARNWTIPTFPIKGRDLKSLGIENGVDMGRLLSALEALWVRSGFTADKEKLLMALPLIRHQMS